MSLTDVTLPDGTEIDLTENRDWIDEDGTRLHFQDYPTDGPLFVDVDEENEEFENVQFESSEFEEMIEDGELVPYERVREQWIEVRRGTPAEELSIVPDDMIEYANWVEDNITGSGAYNVSIYVEFTEGYVVVAGEPDDLTREGEFDDRVEAMREARRLRFERAVSDA